MAAELFERLVANIALVVQGNDEAIRLAVTCLVAGGHLLVEDVPGVGKTSLGKALSASVSCHHRRIQFTSDLLPSDVTGVNVFDVSKASFEFRPGPIFANIVLGDEINRTPPKTQSALLESMEERQVTVDGVAYDCRPVHGHRHAEPAEARGDLPPSGQPARPLPPQDPDRLPGCGGGVAVLEAHGVSEPLEVLQPVATPEDVTALAARARAPDYPLIQRYIVEIANATRSIPPSRWACRRRRRWRCKGRRGRAVLEGRDFVWSDDVKAMAPAVIGHRLELSAAAGRGRGPVAAVFSEILRQVPVPIFRCRHDRSGTDRRVVLTQRGRRTVALGLFAGLLGRVLGIPGLFGLAAAAVVVAMAALVQVRLARRDVTVSARAVPRSSTPASLLVSRSPLRRRARGGCSQPRSFSRPATRRFRPPPADWDARARSYVRAGSGVIRASDLAAWRLHRQCL